MTISRFDHKWKTAIMLFLTFMVTTSNAKSVTPQDIRNTISSVLVGNTIDYTFVIAVAWDHYKGAVTSGL